MDVIGTTLSRWIYPVKLLPMIPYAFPLDWSMLPVLHMLIYQYFPRWKPFLIAELVAGGLLAFVGEPLAEWMGIYSVLHWQHIWSFPLYVMKAVVGKLLIESIVYRGNAQRF
jgi:hypothetical protein